MVSQRNLYSCYVTLRFNMFMLKQIVIFSGSLMVRLSSVDKLP